MYPSRGSVYNTATLYYYVVHATRYDVHTCAVQNEIFIIPRRSWRFGSNESIYCILFSTDTRIRDMKSPVSAAVHVRFDCYVSYAYKFGLFFSIFFFRTNLISSCWHTHTRKCAVVFVFDANVCRITTTLHIYVYTISACPVHASVPHIYLYVFTPFCCFDLVPTCNITVVVWLGHAVQYLSARVSARIRYRNTKTRFCTNICSPRRRRRRAGV